VTENATLDRDVRIHLLRTAVETGRVPQADEIAAGLDLPTGEVETSLRRLAEGRVIVLSPAPHATIVWMANPFSAVPTMFRVTSGDISSWGNCIWDALGIISMTNGDGAISCPCGDCGEPMTLHVQDGALVNNGGILHFGVPARRWWDNIGFT
jgi:hypothetical protein